MVLDVEEDRVAAMGESVIEIRDEALLETTVGEEDLVRTRDDGGCRLIHHHELRVELNWAWAVVNSMYSIVSLKRSLIFYE